jgi:hypothetical protein
MLIKILILLVIVTITNVNGLFETCDQTYNLYAGEIRQINSPYYPQYMYPPGSSCRYYITAPSGYELTAKCQISLPKQSDGSCYSDYFYIGRDGNKTLAGAEFFCGVGLVERKSLFNSIVLAYTSYTTTQSGYFQCNVTATLQACDCGWSKTSKIVGGTNAGVNEFTSMAGLVYRPNAIIFDGGCIIHYRYILTAAHGIIQYKTMSDLAVLVGDHDTSTGSESPYSALYTVLTYIIHENYNSQTSVNDIALVKTTSDIVYSRGVAPACLPFNYQTDFTGAVLDTAGWGTTSFGGPIPNILQKVSLNVISNTQCSSSWGSTMQTSQMCTYTPNKDTCQYDSGGSLFYRTTRMYTVGIVSYGYGCASTKPSINTRVTSYINWIKSKTAEVTYCVK